MHLHKTQWDTTLDEVEIYDGRSRPVARRYYQTGACTKCGRIRKRRVRSI